MSETMNVKPARPLDRSAIIRLVRGIDPVDGVQLRLTASLSPARRALASVRAAEFAMSGLRGTWRRRFPNMPIAELNMKVLAYFTSLRIKPQ